MRAIPIVAVIALGLGTAPAWASTTEVAPTAPNLIITEVMQNPSRVFDSRGEWFEVHNPGDQPVDLLGWVLTDDRTDHFAVDRSLVVSAGGYVVFGRSADPALNGGVAVDHAYGDEMLLRNSIDTLNLTSPDGVLVDRVQWDDGKTFPDPDGASMSLADLSSDNASGSAWCTATSVFGRGDLGTPGGPNRCQPSSYSGSLVVSEILQNPRSVGDSVGEWFELHNAGPTDIDLAGFTFRDEDSDTFGIGTSVIVPAGGHAVIGRSADRGRNGGVAVDHAYGSAMALHNSSDELLVIDAGGVLVDRVAWDDGATFPDPDGASMSVADLSADNGVGANWCTSTVAIGARDLASPGVANDCSQPDVASRVVITEIFANPLAVSDRDGEWFEITNPTPGPVDLGGWTVRDEGSDSFVIDDLVIPSGGRVVFGENGDPTTNGGVELDYVYGDAMVLHNGRDELVLLDDRHRMIDRVAWDDGVAFPDPEGASMSLVDVDADNANGGRWCVAGVAFGDGDLGTPGGPTDCVVVDDYGELTITEIMQNPAAVSDSVGEWFEVLNTGRTQVDLRGWVIKDEKSETHRVTSSVVIAPGQTAVLGRSADRSLNGGVDVAYAYGIDFRMVNSSDTVALVDPSGSVVDRVRYDDGRTFPDPNGASMSLRGPSHDNAEGASWCVSGPQFGAGDRGTPTAANECEKKPKKPEVMITEVMQNPAAVFDSVGEWFEIHNAGREPVDIDGWTIRDDDWDSHVIDNGGPLVIEPGGYLVLGRREAAANGGAEVDYVYGIDLILYNADDELILLDGSLDVVDEVRWDDGATFPDPDGASMSLRPGARENSRGEDWCTSGTPFGSGDLGTPGSENDCGRPCDARNHGEHVSGEAGNPGDNSEAAHSECGKPHTSTTSTTTTTSTTSTSIPPGPTYEHVVLKDNAKPNVTPIAECVAVNPDGSLTARFGYENLEDFDFTLPVGKRNRVTGGPLLGSATGVTEFSHAGVVDGRPGRTEPGAGVFEVRFEPYGKVAWELAGRTAKASSDTPRCD